MTSKDATAAGTDRGQRYVFTQNEPTNTRRTRIQTCQKAGQFSCLSRDNPAEPKHTASIHLTNHSSKPQSYTSCRRAATRNPASDLRMPAI